MSYLITIIRRAGGKPRSYTAIGTLAELQDAAYNDGALGVTAMVQP